MRDYPKPEIQDGGSMDCSYFATAYIAKLFWHDVTWERVKEWAKDKRRANLYLQEVCKISLAWDHYDGGRSSRSIAYSQYPGFRKWVEAFIEHGCIGYASTHIISNYGHAVVILECDADGVLLADSCRGLVKISWEEFIKPLPNCNSHVEAWYLCGDAK